MNQSLRAQSEFAARRCEEAHAPLCRCRCGGKLHGAARAGIKEGTPREFFEKLPEDDPHFVPSEEWLKERARKRKPAWGDPSYEMGGGGLA